MRTTIYNSLNARINPVLYIVVGVGIFIGLSFAQPILVNVDASILYQSGVLIDREVWGMLLAITASTTMAGLITKKNQILAAGSFASFILWAMAGIELALNGFWYVMVTVALLHLLTNGYIYLATSLGILKRNTAL